MTTPTNEAGHRLPKLPQTEEFALRAMATNYGEGHRWDSLDRDVCRRAADEIKILRERIVALSRGVPADMVLVPREPTEAMIEAGWRFHGRAAYEAMVEAAPAAAGAQGEDAVLFENVRGHVISELNKIARRIANVSPNVSEEVEQLAAMLVVGATEPMTPPAPQPAAADGCVRERAIAILAKVCCVKESSIAEHSGSDVSVELALRAISAALSSHRQAGDEPLHALHSRFLSDTSGLPEEWQDWRNDFARDIRALVEKGAGNG